DFGELALEPIGDRRGSMRCRVIGRHEYSPGLDRRPGPGIAAVPRLFMQHLPQVYTISLYDRSASRIVYTDCWVLTAAVQRRFLPGKALVRLENFFGAKMKWTSSSSIQHFGIEVTKFDAGVSGGE